MIYNINKSMLLEEAFSPYTKQVLKSAGLGTLVGGAITGGLVYPEMSRIDDSLANKYARDHYGVDDVYKSTQYGVSKDPTDPLPHMKEYKDNRLAQYVQEYKDSPDRKSPIVKTAPFAALAGAGIGATSGLITSHFVPKNVTQKQLDDANNHMYRTIGLKK